VKRGSPLPPPALRAFRKAVDGMQLASPSRNRVQENISLLGIFWMALSAVNVLGGALLILANMFVTRWNRFPAEVHSTFLQSLLSSLEH